MTDQHLINLLVAGGIGAGIGLLFKRLSAIEKNTRPLAATVIVRRERVRWYERPIPAWAYALLLAFAGFGAVVGILELF